MTTIAEAGSQVVRRSIHTSGRRLSYLTAEPGGGGETIVLIHGSGVSARYWTEQLCALARTLRVLAIDLPGHGESDPIPNASVETYADAVADLLGELGAGRVFVVGHSLGGGVALALAARRPQAVRGLVLLSSCARLPATNGWADHCLAFLPGPLRKIVFFMMAKKMLFAPGASDLAVRLGMQELIACRAETILNDVRAARAMDLAEAARGLDVPTLVVCGSRDRVTPPVQAERLHTLIRGSRLDIVGGAGHMLLLETPARVNRGILDFIASLGAEPPGPLAWRLADSPARSRLRRLLGRARALFRRG